MTLRANLGGAVVFQGIGTMLTYPYYLSYYNPLLGGSRVAPQVMMIGWGEGIDQAARALNQVTGAQPLRVFSWYRTASFSYFFQGHSEQIYPKWRDGNLLDVLHADYAVVYSTHQQQRQAPAPLHTCLAQMAPEHVVRINGLEYVRVYKLSHDLSADPAYVPLDARLGPSIELSGYRLPAGEYTAGNLLPLWLSWRARDAPGERLKVFVQVLDGSGRLVAQDDTEPVAWSRPTDGWQPGEQIVDAHTVSLPGELPAGTYTLIVGMYRASGERLAITRAGEAVGDALTLGPLILKERLP